MRAAGRVLFALALAALAAGCGDTTGGAAVSGAAACVAPSAALDARLAEVVRRADAQARMRVIVTVAQNATCADLAATKAQVARDFRGAGALLVEPMDGLPLIVVECTVDQLRAVVAKGAIADVEIDALVR